MKDYQKRYLDLCIEHHILQFGEFKLKSGRTSPYFFNVGLFNTGNLLNEIGECYAEAILDYQTLFQPEVIFGPAYKGIPLVTTTVVALARKGCNYPYAFNRKEIKDHGEGGNLVGCSDLKNKRVLVVDDVITAGTAIREVMPLLKDKQGGQVVGVLVALDRMERGTGKLSAVQEVQQDLGIPVRAIVTVSDILKYLEHQGNNESLLASMRAYRDQYGVDY
jgi:orotate phosphoribosyltransferase